MNKNEINYFDGNDSEKRELIDKLTFADEIDIRIKERILSSVKDHVKNEEYRINSEKVLFNIREKAAEKESFVSGIYDTMLNTFLELNSRFKLQYKLAAGFSFILLISLFSVFNTFSGNAGEINIRVNLTDFEKTVILGNDVLIDTRISMKGKEADSDNRIKIKFY